MKKIFKSLIIGIIAVILVAAGIKASDLVFSPTETEDGTCPADMVKILSASGDFCIDKYEASVGEDCEFPDPKNENETKLNLDNPNCAPVSIEAAIPWRNITQNEALTACAKAGKRLPSNKEWQAAALATPDKSESWTRDDCQVFNNWPDQPGRTGSGKNCRSAAGAFDMVGNVWEWVSDTVQDGKVGDTKLPAEGYVLSIDDKGFPAETGQNPSDATNKDYFWIKDTEARGVSRGGYWDNKSDAGQYALYAVSRLTFYGVGVGFRCVK